MGIQRTTSLQGYERRLKELPTVFDKFGVPIEQKKKTESTKVLKVEKVVKIGSRIQGIHTSYYKKNDNVVNEKKDTPFLTRFIRNVGDYIEVKKRTPKGEETRTFYDLKSGIRAFKEVDNKQGWNADVFEYNERGTNPKHIWALGEGYLK